MINLILEFLGSFFAATVAKFVLEFLDTLVPAARQYVESLFKLDAV